MSALAAQKYRINVSQWQKMGEAGVFPPQCRIELIDGEIINMAPIGFNHAGHLNRLNKLFSTLVENQAIISVQNPLQLGDLSEPEPDFMLLRPEPSFYSTRHPQADDVLLLVEVADSSLEYDRNDKMRLYALHGIAEYWIVNLNASCLEVHRHPEAGGYADKTALRGGDTIQLLLQNQIRIDVADIL